MLPDLVGSVEDGVRRGEQRDDNSCSLCFAGSWSFVPAFGSLILIDVFDDSLVVTLSWSLKNFSTHSGSLCYVSRSNKRRKT